MKAVALSAYLPIDHPEALLDVELPNPAPGERDLLDRVEAISVNPVDTKIRRSQPGKVEERPRVLGWDAAGVVEAVGKGVSLFKAGEPVYYSGSLARPGANSEFHVVDERIAGNKPASLDFARAAALPLTGITAYEGLFERLGIRLDGSAEGRTILIIGAAGGVGSMAVQMAKLAGMIVIGSASRPESKQWVRDMGADFVVDHSQPLSLVLAEIGHSVVDYIFNCNDTDLYWEPMAACIRPLGKIVLLVDNREPLDLKLFKRKSVTIAWEFMSTRPIFDAPDMRVQHDILAQIAQWADAGRLKTPVTDTLRPINAENLKAAHARLESGKTIGKIVLAGWS